MKKILAAAFLAVLVLVPAALFAAGTIVRTSSDPVDGQDVTVLTYTMTADAADGSYPPTGAGPIDGWIIGVITNPGTVQPTDNYDITLLNSDGADVMAGGILNRDTLNSEFVITPQPYVRGPVTIGVANNVVNSAVVVLKITVLR